MTNAHKIEQTGHYFAASIAEWRTGPNADKLIEDMQREPFPFMVWFVPLPENAAYDVEDFRPVVDGAVNVASYVAL